jgi:hypothetical protein
VTTSKTPSGPAGRADHEAGPAVARVYLTRVQVAEIYPFSVHTLAALASQGKGPRFFKPTDKCLYRPEDIEAWIEAAAVLPLVPEPTSVASGHRRQRVTPPSGRGKAKPKTSLTPTPPSQRDGRKSLPPSANSWLRRTD